MDAQMTLNGGPKKNYSRTHIQVVDVGVKEMGDIRYTSNAATANISNIRIDSLEPKANTPLIPNLR
jgi:hypothetical protein